VRSLPGGVPDSCTHETPLLGADGYRALWNRRATIARETGFEVARIESLLGRYGSQTLEVLDQMRDRPELAEPLEGAEDTLVGEVVYATTHEGALHLDDVLTRRTRISIETFHRGTDSVRAAAHWMGAELGWSEVDRQREVAHYEARVAAERDSQIQHDDQTADAARLGAPDVRRGFSPALDDEPRADASPTGGSAS